MGEVAPATLQLTAWVSPKLSISAQGGTLAFLTNQTVVVRDSLLQFQVQAVDEPTLSAQLGIGANLPTGSLDSPLAITPVSTSSVDPVLTGTVAAGGSWMVVGSALGRLPVYEGSDAVRQGAYWRATVAGARRIGSTVFSVGPSAAGSVESAVEGSIVETSLVASAVLALSDSIALRPNVRAGIWNDPSPVLVPFAGGLSVRWVFIPSADEEEEEHHHPDDGHDHH